MSRTLWGDLVSALRPEAPNDPVDVMLAEMEVGDLGALLESFTGQSDTACSPADWEVFWRVAKALALVDDGLGQVAAWIDARPAGFLSSWQLCKAANRVAWSTRGGTDVAPAAVDSAGDLFLLYVSLERRRFMFDERAVAEILSRTQYADGFYNVAVASFQAFVDLRRSRDGIGARKTVEDVLELPGLREFREVPFDLMAHALWLNMVLEPRGELLEELCRRWANAIPNPGPVADFRFAAALRLRGRYEEAIARAEKALAQITGASEFARTFSEQCIREREMSVAGLAVLESRKNLDDTISDLRSEVADLERRSIVRIIEVLTLFTAAAAFALGGVSVVAGVDTSPRQLLIIMAGFAAGLVLFALLTFVGIELSSSGPVSRKRMSTLVGMVIATCLVVVAGTAGLASWDALWTQ